MLFTTRMSREHIEERLSQLPKKTYNQFIWWRRYQQRQTLHPYRTLYEKIVNGDYETSDYYYQAEHENYLLEDVIKDMKYYEDKLDKIGLFRARYKKLHEDFLKEETEILKNMKKDFKKEFKISNEELDSIMESFDGTVLELYEYIKQSKGTYFDNLKPMPNISAS
jgi:hypothetical protein